MRRKGIPMQKVTANYFRGDPELIQQLYPRHGFSWVMRHLARQFLRYKGVQMAMAPEELLLEEEFAKEKGVKLIEDMTGEDIH